MTSVIESRQRLDKTLLSPALTDAPILSNLVRKQLQNSSPGGAPSDRIVEEKSKQLSTLLDALRSAKGERTVNNDHGEWKVKQDTSRYRVMYREGPEGTPFHSLCLEGIIDGPMSNALVVGWEVPLYKEWWPQFTAPTFKIVESRWLQKGTVGGELSVLRFKVPWPIAMREVVLSSYELDYFDEDLIVVLYNSAPEAPDEDVDGISQDQVPKPVSNAVRMDLHGGFVLQKINNNCNFFRCVVDMDMKLDLVPPWLINFIARQLIGHGYKLYQKAVSSVKDSPFEKLVNSEPMYKRIQGAIECLSPNVYKPTLLPMMPLEIDNPKIREIFKQEDPTLVETAFKNLSDLQQVSTDHSLEELNSNEVSAQENKIVTDKLPVVDSCPPLPSEIAPNYGTSSLEDCSKIAPLSPELEEQLKRDIESNGTSDPEVLWALQVLNRLIGHFNAQKANSQTNGISMQTVSNGEVPNQPAKVDKPQERYHDADEGDGSSLQNPSSEHIMYNTSRVESEAALDKKAKEEPILTNGSIHGNYKQANHLIATGLPTISGIAMNGKVKAGKHHHHEEKHHQHEEKHHHHEEKHHHHGARNHHSHFGYRLFRPFRLRKKDKEGKHSNKTAEAVLVDTTSKIDS